jgi:hypothetical protein
MTVEQLWKADPFRPFKIHLADGRDIAVNHRDFLMPSPSGRKIIVYQPGTVTQGRPLARPSAGLRCVTALR